MRIFLDDKEVETLVPESLPLLIHGREGSGASIYTIVVAAKWFAQGRKVVFLCGYPMAEKQFLEQTGGQAAYFFTKEHVSEFKDELARSDADEAVVFIKNIELFDDVALAAVARFKNVIISGDLGQSALKDSILKMTFVTRVYFSELEGVALPELKKYEGAVVSSDFHGVTKLA